MYCDAVTRSMRDVCQINAKPWLSGEQQSLNSASVAGAYATITPQLQETTSDDIEITGRIRLDSSLPQGRFFAVANNSEKNLVAQLDARKGVQTEDFYLDLISTSISAMNPDAPAELPELSDGPHMAYALQWLFFAGLIIYGRRLIYKTA